MSDQAQSWAMWAEGYAAYARAQKCPYAVRGGDAACWRAGYAAAKAGLVPCDVALLHMSSLHERVTATFEESVAVHGAKWSHLPHRPAQYIRFSGYEEIGQIDGGIVAVGQTPAPPPPKATARISPQPDMAVREKWSGDTDA